MQLPFLREAEDKLATFLSECRGEVHRTENKTRVQKNQKVSSRFFQVTTRKILRLSRWVQQQALKTRWGKQSGFTGTGSVLDKPYWFKGDSKRVCVSLCVRSTVCYLLRSSSSWSWYSVNSLWNRKFSPMTGKTSRSRSRFRRPCKQTREFVWEFFN